MCLISCSAVWWGFGDIGEHGDTGRHIIRLVAHKALVFYSMLYLSICKDYQKISLYFLIGMVITFILSLVLKFLFRWEVTISILFSGPDNSRVIYPDIVPRK